MEAQRSGFIRNLNFSIKSNLTICTTNNGVKNNTHMLPNNSTISAAVQKLKFSHLQYLRLNSHTFHCLKKGDHMVKLLWQLVLSKSKQKRDILQSIGHNTKQSHKRFPMSAWYYMVNRHSTSKNKTKV